MSRAPVRVFFPCTGLGRERRGFETFTRACAAALRGFPELDVTVFGGGGDIAPGERAVWNLPRAGRAARAIGAVFGRDAYYVEQATFFAGFAGALLAQEPDLVYFADVNLGNACWHWRRLTRARYRLLFYNGGVATRAFTRCDMVQQVSPEHLASALARGEPADRQFLLPHGVAIARDFRPADDAECAGLRERLGVPAAGPLVLSVGMLDETIKRMTYVIEEVATMPSQPHLLLVGAESRETPAVRRRAAERLGGRCTIRTLPREAMGDAYRAADAFVLASLVEGFGIAQVEALAAGLPCVAHDSATSAYVLGGLGTLADLRVSGVLASSLERVLRQPRDGAAARHRSAYERFSWDRLAPTYAEALVACARGRRPAEAGAA